jgi:hypothetical protein
MRLSGGVGDSGTGAGRSTKMLWFVEETKMAETKETNDKVTKQEE